MVGLVVHSRVKCPAYLQWSQLFTYETDCCRTLPGYLGAVGQLLWLQKGFNFTRGRFGRVSFQSASGNGLGGERCWSCSQESMLPLVVSHNAPHPTAGFPGVLWQNHHLVYAVCRLSEPVPGGLHAALCLCRETSEEASPGSCRYSMPYSSRSLTMNEDTVSLGFSTQIKKSVTAKLGLEFDLHKENTNT